MDSGFDRAIGAAKQNGHVADLSCRPSYNTRGKIMLNTRSILGARRNWNPGLIQFAAIAFLLIAIPVAGFAQETTGIVRGAVYQPNGDPAAGAATSNEPTKSSPRQRRFEKRRSKIS